MGGGGRKPGAAANRRKGRRLGGGTRAARNSPGPQARLPPSQPCRAAPRGPLLPPPTPTPPRACRGPHAARSGTSRECSAPAPRCIAAGTALGPLVEPPVTSPRQKAWPLPPESELCSVWCSRGGNRALRPTARAAAPRGVLPSRVTRPPSARACSGAVKASETLLKLRQISEISGLGSAKCQYAAGVKVGSAHGVPLPTRVCRGRPGPVSPGWGRPVGRSVPSSGRSWGGTARKCFL